MIHIRCLVPVYEINGSATDDRRENMIRVESYRPRDRMVVLCFRDESFTVEASDLRAAIDNCTNVKRWG